MKIVFDSFKLNKNNYHWFKIIERKTNIKKVALIKTHTLGRKIKQNLKFPP